jgi:pantoate kinase
LVKTAVAFAPGAISSFFEIYNQTPNGAPITDLERLGARGGGFGLQKGTTTKTTITPAKTTTIKTFINGNLVHARTSIAVAKALLARTPKTFEVNIEHTIEIPVGAGFGTSAAGALTTALTISEALNIPLTYNQIGKIAHVADIACQTGLGTVSSLAQCGGCVLVIEPGAPGICVIDRIPIKPDYQIVTCLLKGSSKDILTSPQKRDQINLCGKKTLKSILAEPSLEKLFRFLLAVRQGRRFCH